MNKAREQKFNHRNDWVERQDARRQQREAILKAIVEKNDRPEEENDSAMFDEIAPSGIGNCVRCGHKFIINPGDPLFEVAREINQRPSNRRVDSVILVTPHECLRCSQIKTLRHPAYDGAMGIFAEM